MRFCHLLVDTVAPAASAEPHYWFETRRPFCNLVFLLPLLLVYELGVLVIGGAQSEAFRNGADAWMRQFLLRLGIDLLWVLPMTLVGALLCLQWASRQPWRMSWDTLGGMIAESLLFAFALILLGQAVDSCFRQQPANLLQMEGAGWTSSMLVRSVTFLGAGIYEEFLFRLCLIPVTYTGFRALLLPHRWSVGATIVLTSLVFSLAHYLGTPDQVCSLSVLTDAVERVRTTRALWFSFVFRTLAGMFFAALFFLRGFGITVGAHAAYDVIVGAVLISEL
jgi:membrane protease YdiL (CAAX protease family)